MKNRRKDRQSAFTLIEMLVSTGVAVIAGGSIYLAINSGLIMFAKNTSVNAAHQQLLRAVKHMTRDAHASIATPQLLDISSGGAITNNIGTGPAAGVSFQLLWQHPFKMTAGGSGGTSNITIDTASVPAASPSPSPTPGLRPTAGQRAYLPGDDNTEENITAAVAAASPTYTQITLQNPLWKTISPNAGNYVRPVLIADVVAYVVVPGATGFYDLHFYTQQYSGGTFSWLDRGVRVRNLISSNPPNPPLPFSIAGGQTVIGTLMISDPSYSKRGFQALGIPLTFQAPYRSKLSIY